jgi:hypothetical protein
MDGFPVAKKSVIFEVTVKSTNTHLYNSVAILVASEILRQSINQKRADTVVVNETQSFTKVSGVDPVTSSH